MTGPGAACLLAALAAAPPLSVEVDGEVGDAAAVRGVVEDALTRIDAQVRRVGGAAPVHRLSVVRVRRGFALPAAQAAASTPGVIEVRPLPAVDERARLFLAHEAAHQILWSTCPAASSDALFHEAFAVWASGEAGLWLDEESYLPLPRARELLEKNALDSRAGRRALARLVTEERELPRALAARLRACADGARVPPLTVAELAAHAADQVDVLLVVQRATGELVSAQGELDRPLPFGSTLKPFLLGAARMADKRPPELAPRVTDPMWACHQPEGTRTLGPDDALLLSCNGWFLDWATRDPDAARFGELLPLLLDAGLSASPSTMQEAIGVQASLTLSPRGLALAYRALSWARPDVIELLRANVQRGTLAGAALPHGVATKTGTVRGLGSAPDLGWLVAVTDDVVVVRARSGVTPQALVGDVAVALRALPRGARQVAVQTFGLLPPEEVRARCERGGFTVGPRDVEPVGATGVALAPLARRGASLCAAPWMVTLDEERTRPYAGVFTWSPPPEPEGDAAEAAPATPRQERARRGSDFVFFTSLARYTASVLAAEDSRAQGAAREALGRVAAHNVEHPEERHGGRPLCDTTHCQVFLGTGAPALDEAALAPLKGGSFLSFSKGGMQPWRAERSLAEWRAALHERAGLDAGDVRVVRVEEGKLALLVRTASGDGEDALELPCEPLRDALRLPSCPRELTIEGTRVRFRGVGEGHGVGLDVERAKAQAAAGQSAAEILRQAYGRAVVGENG